VYSARFYPFSFSQGVTNKQKAAQGRLLVLSVIARHEAICAPNGGNLTSNKAR